MSELDFKAASHDGYGADSAIRTTPSAAPSWIISTRASGTMPTLESKPGPVLPAAPLASTFYANAFGPTATPVVSGSETQSGSLSPLHPPRWRPAYRSDLQQPIHLTRNPDSATITSMPPGLWGRLSAGSRLPGGSSSIRTRLIRQSRQSRMRILSLLLSFASFSSVKVSHKDSK